MREVKCPHPDCDQIDHPGFIWHANSKDDYWMKGFDNRKVRAEDAFARWGISKAKERK